MLQGIMRHGLAHNSPNWKKSFLRKTLSGHAHGGQFRLPFLGGVIAPNQRLFPKYDAGLYTQDSTTMIVSRGIGNSIVPVRFNNRPEIVVIAFISANHKQQGTR